VQAAFHCADVKVLRCAASASWREARWLQKSRVPKVFWFQTAQS
jgi:hypothetical protein